MLSDYFFSLFLNFISAGVNGTVGNFRGRFSRNQLFNCSNRSGFRTLVKITIWLITEQEKSKLTLLRCPTLQRLIMKKAAIPILCPVPWIPQRQLSKVKSPRKGSYPAFDFDNQGSTYQNRSVQDQDRQNSSFEKF